ncbi:MAG: 50S ribosomal protein L1 [Patescibacteria group bacterium]|jgi:large subunit ribosomal protein L1
MAKEKEEKVSEVTEEEIIDEKKILKAAEEREREIKKEIEEAKAEAKAEKKAEAVIKNIRKAPRHGKKYREVETKIEKSETYEEIDAIKLVKETSTTKFDSSIELHVRIDKKTENIRGTVNLPGGAAKQKNVAEVTEKNIDEFVEKVKSGKIDFDLVVTSPAMMPKLAQLAKILGPKGMMPNPKTGTVTDDVTKVAAEFKGGKLEFKADKTNIVHVLVGRVSFKDEDIQANIDAILSALPKGKIVSAYLASTMGPSVRFAVSKK